MIRKGQFQVRGETGWVMVVHPASPGGVDYICAADRAKTGSAGKLSVSTLASKRICYAHTFRRDSNSFINRAKTRNENPDALQMNSGWARLGKSMATLGDHTLRILVVDDEPLVLNSIRLLLQSDGHTVVTAEDGKEALVFANRGGFDLLITDLAMPEMNGNDLVAAIKMKFPNLPVIMATAYAEGLAPFSPVLEGVDILIGKPFSRDELRGAIARALPRSGQHT